MKKKLLTILIGLILLSGAIAFTIGEVLTQPKFNQVDLDSLDFQMEITNIYEENDRVFFEYEYKTFEMVKDENGFDTNTFEYVTKTNRIPYYLGLWRECRDTNTISECNLEMLEFVYEKAEAFRLKERVDLEKQKTEEQLNQIALNEIDINNFKDLYINYDYYKPNHDYSIGDILVYDDELYEVVQAHTSQNDWKPSNVPALYKVKVLQEEGEIREWIQPVGASDCYALGDKVTYGGDTWENTGHSCNVWAPGVYGWTKVS